jgi:dTDP-4-dehydrorhamnose 3,5-epimerase
MNIIPTSLPGVLILEPSVFTDERGFFMEAFHKERYARLGVHVSFVQDNLSYSTRSTLRGLHYQYPHSQAKLVQVVQGELYDVAVDIRRGSPNFGRWTGVFLTGEKKRQLFIPEGFAHGFWVLSESVFCVYKCSDYYSPGHEGGVLWSDPDLGIDWPSGNPLLSQKDADYPRLRDIPPERLPEDGVGSLAVKRNQ